MNLEKKHFGSLDGLRAICCIGIMMMHIQANTHYQVSGFTYERLIPFFTHFVLLFLMISGFGMCVGYFDKIQNGTLDLESFYRKRYKKLLPFFCFLMLIAIIMEPSWDHFFDITMEVTLLYGLLPNNALDVIGVGWTIGVIFLFYLLFPAFTVLLKNKKRSWIMLVFSLWLNFICQIRYFSNFFVNELFTPRHSFIYCLPLFIGGGIIFLYRYYLQKICQTWVRWLFLFFNVFMSVFYFFVPDEIASFNITFYKGFVLFFLWLSYFVGVDSLVLSNKILRILGNVSLEIYLCHMFVFRAYEKMGILYLFGEGKISYLFICLITLIGVLCLISFYKISIRICKKIYLSIKKD